MRFYYLLFFILPLAIPAHTQDTVALKHHFFGIDPIDACLGSAIGTYEFTAGKHGVFMAGNYTFPLLGTKAYAGSLGYRYHFNQANTGTFIGPYFKYGKSHSSVTDESRTTYSYDFTYASIGANWGYRRNLWKKYRLYYTFRIGAGYPFSTLTWKGETPESIGGMSLHSFSNIIKLPAFLDSELTLTFAL
jgi:hypothetical protein